MTLSYAEIAEIIKLIDASSCEEITLDLDEIKLSMRRHSAGTPAQVTVTPDRTQAATDANAAPIAVPDSVAPQVPASTTNDKAAPPANGMIEIRSPMVGTFYAAPSPTSPPFVEIDSVVKVEDPLCLIEVMKLYTTISAKKPGRVVEICSESGAMVAANELLFRIEPL